MNYELFDKREGYDTVEPQYFAVLYDKWQSNYKNKIFYGYLYM